MAFYILILKEQEDDGKVVYRFGPDEQNFGLLKLSKKDGKIEEITQVTVDNSSAFFTRAATKVYRHWKQGKFPQKIMWAS